MHVSPENYKKTATILFLWCHRAMMFLDCVLSNQNLLVDFPSKIRSIINANFIAFPDTINFAHI